MASPELCLLRSQEHLASASTGGTRGSALSLPVATAWSSGHGTHRGWRSTFVLGHPSLPAAPRSGLRRLRVDGVPPACERSFQTLAWALSAHLRPSAASRCSPVCALLCSLTTWGMRFSSACLSVCFHIRWNGHNYSFPQ